MTTAVPGAALGVLAFADARGCKEWLNTLPVTHLAQAQPLALEQLRALNAADMPGIERLKCLELMREKVGFMLGEQRAKHVGATLPLGAAEREAWTAGAALLAELETGYRRCAEEAAGDAALAQHAALVAHRLTRYIAGQMLWQAIARRRFAPDLWSRLHAQFAAAEKAGIATEPVKDSLAAEGGASSVAQAYAQAVLLHAGAIGRMSAEQIDFCEALVRLWGRKLAVATTPPAEAGARALVVDLAQGAGPRHAGAEAAAPGARFIDIAGLSASLRKRIHALQKGEDVASLGLPAQSGGVDPLAEMQRLHRWWCESGAATPAGHPSQVARASLVFGIPDLHFFASGGKAFEPPGKSRELTPQEKQDIEVFGRITERTQSRMLGAEKRVTAEAWPVVDESPGFVRLERPANAAKPVGVGRIVGIRLGDAGDFYVGMVSEIGQEDDGKVHATVMIFPGKPQPIAVRATRTRAADTWQPALRLPALEKLHVEGSLVVPATLGTRGRALEIWEDGEAQQAVVRTLLARGHDFDRVVAS